MEEPGRLQSMGLQRIGNDWATSLSCIGEGNGNPFQYSCLENPRDGGACWASVYVVAQSRTRLKWLSSSRSHRITLHFRASHKPFLLPALLTNWLQAQGCNDSLIRFNTRRAHRTQENPLAHWIIDFYHKGYLKDLNQQPSLQGDEETHGSRSPTQALLSSQTLGPHGATPSDTDPPSVEALQRPKSVLSGFYGASFIIQSWLTKSLANSRWFNLKPLPEIGDRWDWKVQPAHHVVGSPWQRVCILRCFWKSPYSLNKTPFSHLVYPNGLGNCEPGTLLLLLSHFSRVRLCATP